MYIRHLQLALICGMVIQRRKLRANYHRIYIVNYVYLDIITKYAQCTIASFVNKSMLYLNQSILVILHIKVSK